jgi:DNA invertase Pin-like site-specific DNA recombinase
VSQIVYILKLILAHIVILQTSKKKGNGNGHCRLHKSEQRRAEPDVQLEKLKGCERVFKEKRSGVDAGRPALKQCLKYLRNGDILLVSKINRLAREDLVAIGLAAFIVTR